MADAEDGFSADAVQKFLVSNGGRATNVQVVGHFSKYLNDPERKVLNRQKFKDFINEVATVKQEKGEKFLVLKNEYFYREWIEPKHVIIRSAQSQQPKASWPPPAPEQPMETDPTPVPPTRKKKKSHDHSSANQNGSSSGGRSSPRPKSGRISPRPTISAPIYTGPVGQESVVSTIAGEKVIEELSQIEGVKDARDKFELESRLQTPSPSKPPSSTPKAADEAAEKPSDIPPAPVEIQVTEEEEEEKKEEDTPMENLNEAREKLEEGPRIETPPPARPPVPVVTSGVAEAQKPVQDGASPMHHHDDEDHALIGSDLIESASSDTLRSIKSTSSGNSYPDTQPKLGHLEREWMMESAKGNVIALRELLDQEPSLASKKDFITGFSALHWGAKHGKKEMIRLMMDRGVDVNMRSQGGYTPLHVAAMHNKEAIMQFLVSEYHADINKRDFSGRKPRHYLHISASSYIKLEEEDKEEEREEEKFEIVEERYRLSIRSEHSFTYSLTKFKEQLLLSLD